MKQKIIQVFSLLIVLTFVCKSYGQTLVNTDTLSGYPSSVINRVYNVAKYVALNDSEQVALANLFTDEEQQISGLVLSGVADASIDSIKIWYKYQFNNTLSANKINSYYAALAQKNSSQRIRVATNLLYNKYTPDTLLNSYLTNVFSWREAQIEQVQMQYTDSATREHNLYAISSSYDSLYESYLNVVKGNAYLRQQLQFLDGVSRVDSGRRTAITNLYNNLCIGNSTRAYADNFKTAFYTVFTNLGDTSYYSALYSNDIIKAAAASTAKALYSYSQSQFISTSDLQSLTPIVMNRETPIAAINMMFSASNGYRDSLVQIVMDNYQPSIGAILDRGRVLENNSLIPLALKLRDTLGLSSVQDSLLIVATNNLDPNYLTDYNAYGTYVSQSSYDASILKPILSWDQFNTLLQIKYSYQADLQTREDLYYALHNANFNLDYNESYTELYNYHLQELVTNNYWADDQNMQFSNLLSVMSNMPGFYTNLLDYKYQYAIENTYPSNDAGMSIAFSFYQW